MKNKLPGSIAHAIRGLTFPASNDDLTRQAKSNKAPADVIELIQRLPDLEYNSLAEVMRILQANADAI